ncbi:hypothetical protein [Homoserinibacter sp. GY 40078]|uniref:hypothetical protein n=1 Tax=Homoserinibacter sp. GY 40078 TaxID=2603275 RepID=UPI0011C78948|nr:hypothetical protein [Homoserinibacter sp. GY 40078]TXK17412.1 hypothetical protein FVQ89_11295 [Homoserinibacter sp. GY 40078]
MIGLPAGVLPVRDVTTREILYGSRTTSHRYELLKHNPATGRDSLIGELDGVEPGGSLSWSVSARVKKSGSITVHDLATAASGMTRIADIDLVQVRIRPVLVIEGLPEQPLGVYVVTASPEAWTATGRTFAVELHDKSTALDQDAFDTTFVAEAGLPVLEIVRDIIKSAGESIVIDGSDTRTLASSLVFPVAPETTKLTIVNDLLKVLDYTALWVDGVGNFRATPYVRPADRSIRYAMLNDSDGQQLVRELTDGEESVYSPDFKRDRDSFGVPNIVVAVATGDGDAEPLTGSWSNDDPACPYSRLVPDPDNPGEYVRALRRVKVLSGVDVPDFSAEPDPAGATEAHLSSVARQSLIASSSVQAAVSVRCLPLPLELLDAVRFESTPAGVDARHTVQRVEIPLRFDELMSVDLQEVIDL